ncbi:uncharacterized protein [Montipora foliosa]|uniref:uncharacterized protein n=1 Tax=Montipora foliosa TaxID=591990 RepID=UPI0035F1349E
MKMGEKPTPRAYWVESSEMSSFFKNPSTSTIRDDSELQDAGKEIDSQRRCNSPRLTVGIIVVLGITCLLIGIVLISLAKNKKVVCDDFEPTKNQIQNGSETAEYSVFCASSEEAVRVSFIQFLEKVRDKAFALNPNMIFLKPGVSSEELRRHFKPFDPTPSEIKRRTDESWRLLAEINDTDIDEAKLFPRERKALSQVKFYLLHVFGQPYDANYYNADWMLGPNFFCLQPICHLGAEMFYHLEFFAPRNTSDLDLIRNILEAYNKSINQYIENVELGVKSGMVGSVEECRAGLHSIKGFYSHTAISSTGVLDEDFAVLLQRPSFYQGLSQESSDEWQNRTGKTVLDSMKELLIQNIGKPLNNLISYLEDEHMRHCVPSNISSGLFNRPLKYVFVDGKPDSSQPTVRNLGTGEKIIGAQSYIRLLSFFTTTEITPDEVYDKGWEMVNRTYPEILALARKITGLNDTEAAVKQLKAKISSQDMYFNKVPFPANESGAQAYLKCNSMEGAMKFCPKRWEALRKWFKVSREAMSFLEPKTVNMFFFTGKNDTTPSCPVELVPDFNPSSASQSYENSGARCPHNCRYNVPFFLENMGPIFSEWTVNAHEARPGHHTQVQGFVEHFTDKCDGVISWINEAVQSVAFEEGWGLYAEVLIAEDTDSYKDHLWQKYGALKWRLWRALRLILDAGLHSKGMTRKVGLDLLTKYAWDTSDVAQKEMTRYQSGAGQATAYMIGQLKIQKLRDYAEKTLKDNFNLKEFHYQILNQGTAPLSFLESHVKQFVECKLKPQISGCERILQPSNVDNSIDGGVSFKRNRYFNWPYPRRYYA